MASSTASPPSTMRAWQYTSLKGGIEQALHLAPSVPVPNPEPNQHLVRIIATALNPVDYKPAEIIPGVRRFAIPKTATPGIDIAGTLVTPASGSLLKPGQLVFGVSGTSPFNGRGLMEYSVAKSGNIMPIPEGVDVIDAATVGVAGITAYQSIVSHVKAGDRIFINGGSGGVGCFGIQCAKAVGCHVTTTCSTPNVELCKSLGADRVIDYKRENVLQALKDSGHEFDHGVDNVGSDANLIWHSSEFLKTGATFVVVAAEPSLKSVMEMMKRKFWPSFLGGMKGKAEGFWPQQKTEDWLTIVQWMKEGKVKAVVDSKFGFEEAPKAFEKSKTGRARGKIVILVADENNEGSA